MVLLKNDGILPLQSEAPKENKSKLKLHIPTRNNQVKTIAVIGPNGASLASLEGNYNGIAHDPMMPVDALRKALPGMKVLYAPGSSFVDGFAMPVSRTMLHPANGSGEEGLRAEYFTSTSMSGAPAVTRIDHEIAFDWSGVSALANAADSPFSVRWTGSISAPKAGSYELTLRTGRCRGCGTLQSYRVLIDGQQVAASEAISVSTGNGPVRINGTTGLPETERSQGPGKFTVNFAEGQQHRIEIDFVRESATEGSGPTLEWTPPAGVLLPGALEAVKKSDLAVMMLGLSPNLEGEEMPIKLPGFVGGDRSDIHLPASQEQLLEQVAATGKPMIVVLLNGSALAVNFASEHARAILEAWYPGEAGAQAIADTLTGANNPSGRLPVTFYASESALPEFTDYAMKNRTYRYFTGEPLYSFGYGLSYTKFAYSGVKLSTSNLNAGDTLTVEADVKNTGKMAGDEIAELYLTPPAGSNGGLSPKLLLDGFQRVHLGAGESKHVTFTLDPRQLSLVDGQGGRAVQPGSYGIAVGGSQPKDPHAPAPAQTATFTITGTQPLPH